MALVGLITLLAIVAAFIFLGYTASTPAATTSAESLPRQRCVRLSQIYPSTDYKEKMDKGVDIIAIHGLDTKSPDTWEFKTPLGGKVNWLKDGHMLPAEVTNVRIFTCDWPAQMFETIDSEQDTIEELARLLLAAIRERAHQAQEDGNRPILFIASCLGGIILMKALVMARTNYSDIQKSTRGVVFLGTPFRGTSFQDVVRWAEPGLKAKAFLQGRRVTMLLGWAGPETKALWELVRSFVELTKDQSYHIDSFYEKGFTDLALKVPLLSFILFTSKKQVRVRKNKIHYPAVCLLTLVSWLIARQLHWIPSRIHAVWTENMS